MNNLDLIKKAIYEDTIVRDTALNNDATRQYYNNLLEALSIEDFPLLEVNTIAKKTYMLECQNGKQCYLVFDHYLIDNIHILNQIVLKRLGPEHLEAYFFKAMAEECYTSKKYSLSIQFAGSYLNVIDRVIDQYLEKPLDEDISNYLFIQQAFLIAHELFHFFLNRETPLQFAGIESKRKYLESIYIIAHEKDRTTAEKIRNAINSTAFIMECLCDSTGMIQAIDVATKLGRLDAVEASLSAALAIMNQFTISTIQYAVKQSGRVSYDGVINLFNARLLHFKAYASLYIKENFSEYENYIFQQRVESTYMSWMNTVHLPIVKKISLWSEKLKEDDNFDDCGLEKQSRLKKVLKQIFNS